MYYLDLRFVVPALINLILNLFLLQQHQEPIFNPNLWLISIVTLLFLLTSVKLPLDISVTAKPVRVQAGDFSCPLAVSLIASVFFPQTHFWVGYGIIISISPWHGLLSNSLVKFLWWIWDILQAIPVLTISCIVRQHQEGGEPQPHQVELVDVGGAYQTTSEHEIVLDVQP